MTEYFNMKNLIEQYFKWLRDNTILRGLQNDWMEITTPFLDRHNDCLQIYVKQEHGGLRLTDDGYILGDLQMSGCELDSPKRQAIFKEILSGVGVQCNDGRLEILSDASNFAQHKHDLIQAMLSVNDMFYLASPHVASLFYEDATQWLDAIGVRYIKKIILRGKSGFTHSFLAVIPKSDSHPERVIQAINRPDKDTVLQLIFDWHDTKEARGPDSLLYPLLNDSEKQIRQEITAAFSEYGITGIPWSNRDQFSEILRA